MKLRESGAEIGEGAAGGGSISPPHVAGRQAEGQRLDLCFKDLFEMGSGWLHERCSDPKRLRFSMARGVFTPDVLRGEFDVSMVVAICEWPIICLQGGQGHPSAHHISPKLWRNRWGIGVKGPDSEPDGAETRASPRGSQGLGRAVGP